jgi:hypothetical protein
MLTVSTDLEPKKESTNPQDTLTSPTNYFSSIFDFISEPMSVVNNIYDENWDKLDLGITAQKYSVLEFTNQPLVAIWNFDGTLRSASQIFVQTFKIPQQFIAFSTIGPHFTSLIPCMHFEKNFSIFNSVFKGILSQYSGELVLREFNSELSQHNSIKEVTCFVSLNTVLGYNNAPLYVFCSVSLPEQKPQQ